VWPENNIDHVDGDEGNNRIVNLRDVTQGQNLRNTARPSDNQSGCTGVSWIADERRWRAYIRENKRQRFLGQFANIADAIAARKAAEAELGYHPNHGRAAGGC